MPKKPTRQTQVRENYGGAIMKPLIVDQGNLVIEIRDDGGLIYSGYHIPQMLGFICQTRADNAEAAINVLKQLGEMGREVVDLQNTVHGLYAGPRCCGHKWRNKAGRLYMHHGLNEACPMHGKPPADADRGLRSYVKAEEEADVLAAAANFELWKIRKSELTQLKNKLDSLSHRLKMIGNGGRGW